VWHQGLRDVATDPPPAARFFRFDTIVSTLARPGLPASVLSPDAHECAVNLRLTGRVSSVSARRPAGRTCGENTTTSVIAPGFPGPDLLLRYRWVIDPPIETLLIHNAELDFGHVQPAPVLWGRMNLQPIQQLG
jgi:hypothetical protein